MKLCPHCGKELLDSAIRCSNCGKPVPTTEKKFKAESTKDVDYSINGFFVVLALFWPLFGFIYWPVKAKTRPRCAMACGIVAFFSWAFRWLFSLIGHGRFFYLW